MIADNLSIQDMPFDELEELWENAGRNLSSERLAALLGKDPISCGEAEAHFLAVLKEMRKRGIPVS